MLFPAVLMNFPNSKVCLIGEWSIERSVTGPFSQRSTESRGLPHVMLTGWVAISPTWPFHCSCALWSDMSRKVAVRGALRKPSTRSSCATQCSFQPQARTMISILALTYLSASSAICGMPKYFLKCSRTLRTPCRRFATSLYCLFLVNILERWPLKVIKASQHIVIGVLRGQSVGPDTAD